MKKCFRYLLMFNAPNYGMALGFAGVILAGCYLTGVPTEGRGLFYGYFNMFPSMLLMAALLSGTAFCTSSLNHALSYGARRRDYFWGMQGIILVNTLVYCLMNAVFLALPDILNWHPDFNGTKFSPTFPLAMIMVHAVGCASGRLYIKSRLWAGIINGLAIFLLILNPISETILAHSTKPIWGGFPIAGAALCLLITFVCEFWTFSVILDATVR